MERGLGHFLNDNAAYELRAPAALVVFVQAVVFLHRKRRHPLADLWDFKNRRLHASKITNHTRVVEGLNSLPGTHSNTVSHAVRASLLNATGLCSSTLCCQYRNHLMHK